MSSDKKVVLILEDSKVPLVRGGENKYILEGIFAQFGVENNNKRIYEEKEYLPHLKYLEEKIKNNNLFGELDHPDKFDISLKNVSHIIEDLQYNKDKRQIVGRIKILDTEAGKNAKALLDGGVQLSISSRAAGVVKEDKTVQIKRIFTYDLVAEPGFQNAQLNRINEHVGLSFDSNIGVFEMVDFDETSLYTEEELTELNNENKNSINMTDKFVSVSMLDSYSKEITKEFEKIHKVLENSNTNQASNNPNDIEERYNDLVKFTNYLSEQLNNTVSYAEYAVQKIEEVKNYAEYISETTENVIKYSESIAEQSDNTIKYVEYISEKVESNPGSSNNSDVENLIAYANYLREGLNSSIQFSEYLGENLKMAIDHSDDIAESVNNLGGYTEYLKDNIDANINFTEHVAEHVDNTIKYTEYVAGVDGSNTETIKESINIDSLNTKIDKILENAKKLKADNYSSKATFPFFTLLGESKQREFLILPENQKQKIMENVNSLKPMSEKDFIAIWEDTMNPKSEAKLFEKVVNEMPEEYKKVWENMNDGQKNTIVAQSRFFKLNTPAQIKHFWQTRNGMNERVENNNINESLAIDNGGTNTSNPKEAYMKSIANRASKLSR